MQVWNTYFYLAEESSYSGPQDTGIYKPDGSLIAMCRRTFVADLCVEGSGKLLDGRVVNYASGCSYGELTCVTGGHQCYSVLDVARFPWGKGVQNRALRPLRSIATDPSVIPFGSYVMIEQFRGLEIPTVGGLGGFTHDGCFRAEDTGGWILTSHEPSAGPHIDIFSGNRAMYSVLDRLVRTRSHLNLEIKGSESCETAAPPTDLSSWVLPVAIAGGGLYVASRPSVQAWFRKLWANSR